MDGALDAPSPTDAPTDAPEGSLTCDASLYHRPCGEPNTSYHQRCAQECVCPYLLFEVCDVDEVGSCGRTLSFCEAVEVFTFCAGPRDGACDWRIEFRSGRYEWAHSDVVESGEYTCDGTTVTSDMYEGSWDGVWQSLVWDGVRYQAVPPECTP